MSEDLRELSEVPSLEDMLGYLSDAPDPEFDPSRFEEDFQASFTTSATLAEEQFAHLQGLQSHYKHKSAWSYFLMALMAGLIIFQSFLLCKVGSQQWDFTAYDWLLPLLLVQNFAQIIGLAVFVVKSLFTPVN